MTLNDFSVEFDLLYNNALSSSAPSLNAYEKSLFLTQAQENLIRKAYNDKQGGTGFELTEQIRRRLEPLTVHKVVTYDSTLNTSLAGLKISDNSKFFTIEDDVWYITLEQAKTATKSMRILPITQDEYTTLSENIFKKPNKRKVWRLDISNSYTTDKVVELVSDQTLASYVYRYLKAPTPIILVDLETDAEVGGLGLTINDETTATNPILPDEAHRLIIKEAVELATLAYKENTLANNVQMNQNNL